MTIEVEDYKLEQCSESSDRFDLYMSKKTDPNHRLSKGLETERQIVIGYGMNLERCLEKMVWNNLNNRKEVVSLQEFLELWKSEICKLEKLLNSVMSA